MPFRFTHYLQVKTTLLFFSKILTKFLDNLIKRFVESQRDIPKDTDSYGEVNLQLELKRAPTMDKQLSVRVVSAERLLWRTSGTFKPYIELNNYLAHYMKLLYANIGYNQYVIGNMIEYNYSLNNVMEF